MFTYDLPQSRIAQRPCWGSNDRATSKLLVGLESGIIDSSYACLPELLQPGDLVVLNNTRVEPRRLFLKRASGAKVEVFLLEKDSSDLWLALIRPLKRVNEGEKLLSENGFVVLKEKCEDGKALVELSSDNLFDIDGSVPIPPYIRGGGSDEADKTDYQTPFAEVPGSIAAPTAGLKFTQELLKSFSSKGIHYDFLTLQLGEASIRLNAERTFPEQFLVSKELVSKVKLASRVIAVGTTVVRALETFFTDDLKPDVFHTTELFIEPGYQFKVVNSLVTNFHQPGSTHLKLVSAFVGEGALRDIYAHALDRDYMFLSYGDGMLIHNHC